MSDREHCKDCVHISVKGPTGYYTCEFPVPHWALPAQLVDPEKAITCPTFSQKMVVVHVSPAIDEKCNHQWPDEADGQTDMNGRCTKCGLSFQRYIHSCCP